MSNIKMAEALGMNYSDMKEYRYQDTRWSKPVWAVGASYYTITSGNRPPKVIDIVDGTDFLDSAEEGAKWRKMDVGELYMTRPNVVVWTYCCDEK